MWINLRRRHAMVAMAVLASAPATVFAQPPAVAAKTVNLRAGPGQDYPLVLRVGAGTPLAVQGCIDGYGWCDVIDPGNHRGWVYAGNIAYAYQDNRVPLLQYGAVIGLPIIAFTLGSYWGDHYRSRPFYRDRSRWEHRPIAPPRGFAGPPPGQGRPAFDARRHGDGRFPGGGRPVEAGRPGDGGRPGFGRGDDRGGRPNRRGPDAGRPDAGPGRPGVPPPAAGRGPGDERGGGAGGERGGPGRDHGRR